MEDWLATPPELGGRRFGPLPDVVHIGTDPSRCDLVLALRTGLPAVTLSLTRQQAGWVIAVPTPGAWALGMRRSDEPGPPSPARPGARFGPGDTLVIGASPPIALTLLRATSAGLAAPDDPARLVHVPTGPAARDAGATSSATPTGPTSSSAVPQGPWADELSRQASARVVASSGFAQRVDATARWLRTGGWKSPVVIVPAVLALLTGLTGVTAGVAWLIASWLR